MKKIAFALIAVILCISMYCILIGGKNTQDLKGKITYTSYENRIRGVNILDLKTGQKDFIPNFNAIKPINSNRVLLSSYEEIVDYDLENKSINAEYNIGENYYYDYFSVKDDKTISLSKSSKTIELFDLNTQEWKNVVSDNNSEYYSWFNDILVYSNNNDEIIEYNVVSGEKKVIGHGRKPLISSDYTTIAYMNSDRKLTVMKRDTGKQYVYKGEAYDYCFSPEGNWLLIEDETEGLIFFKNLLFNGIIKSHQLLVWDYKNNKKTTLVETCMWGAGAGFSWQ